MVPRSMMYILMMKLVLQSYESFAILTHLHLLSSMQYQLFLSIKIDGNLALVLMLAFVKNTG